MTGIKTKITLHSTFNVNQAQVWCYNLVYIYDLFKL